MPSCGELCPNHTDLYKAVPVSGRSRALKVSEKVTCRPFARASPLPLMLEGDERSVELCAQGDR